MATYAVKWEEKILVTEQNKDKLIWYKFIEQDHLEEWDYVSKLIIERRDLNRYLSDMWLNSVAMPTETWVSDMMQKQSVDIENRIKEIDTELLWKEQWLVEDIFNSLFM